MQEKEKKMGNKNSLKEFGDILIQFIKSGVKKRGNLAFLNLLIIFGLLLYSAIPFIGEEISTVVYTLGDVGGQLFLGKHVVHDVDTTPNIIYIVFILSGFSICMFFVKKDKEGKLW